MAGLADLATAIQLSAAVESMRFDYRIESFEFKPSIGISAKKLSMLADEFNDLRVPLTKSVKDVMTISILENFMSGGRPSWDSLSESTLVRRRENGTGDMILVRSGALAEAASSENIWSIGKTTAAVRALPANVWYGNIHQAGHEGNSFGAGNWFKKYQNAARKSLGPEATNKEVDALAFSSFDKRTKQHGAAPQGSSAIPARPFIMFQPEDVDAIEMIFYEWMELKVREAGF